MYLIRLSPVSWFSNNDIFSSSDPTLCIWDLIFCHNIYWIVWWFSASFVELYYERELSVSWYELICKWFLSAESISLIHWMVWYYHTTYKHVLALWMPWWLEDLLVYCSTWLKKSTKKTTLTLTICPDIRTLSQYYVLLNSKYVDIDILLLSTASTTKTKYKLRESLRKKKSMHILTTWAEIFYPWHGLISIEIVSPHRRWYQYQSEPRFHTYRVAQQISNTYHCPLHIL